MQLAIPDPASVPLKFTLTLALYQPFPLGEAGDTSAVTVGSVLSRLIPLTVAEVVLSALSLTDASAERFEPSVLITLLPGQATMPERLSAHVHLMVTSFMYQSLA